MKQPEHLPLLRRQQVQHAPWCEERFWQHPSVFLYPFLLLL